MIKRKIVLFLSIFSMLLFSTSAAASSNESLKNDDIDFDFQKKCISTYESGNLYRKLYYSFSEDEDGTKIYPDTYAGAWVEGKKLFIAVTDNSDKTINFYNEILEKTENVNYVLVDNSLSYLENLGDCITESISKEYTVYGHYTDMKNNKQIIEVSDSRSLNELNGIVQLNTFNSVSTKGNTDNSPFSDDIEFVVGEKIVTEANVIGGGKITTSNGSRSIGVCGTITMPNGTQYEGFVTAGHNLAISQVVNWNDYEFGKVCILKYSNGQNGDYAMVRKTSSSDTLTNMIYGIDSDHGRYITGYDYSLAVGEEVKKYGKKSGYAQGEVTAVNYSVTTTTNDISTTITGLTRCRITSGDSAKGDSGGPYYHYAEGATSGHNYNFVGVHHGSSTNYMYFTPYDYFDQYFVPYTSSPTS